MTLRNIFLTTVLGSALWMIPLGSSRGAEDGRSLPAKIEARLAESRDLEGVRPAEANVIARQSLDDARRFGDRALILKALYQAAHAARVASDYPFTLEIIREGLDLAQALRDDRMTASLLQVRGAAQWNQASLVDATNSYIESLRISEGLQDKALIAGAHTGLGLVCMRSDDGAGSRYHLNVALDLARQLDDKPRLASILNNLGNQLLLDKDYEHARANFEEALTISKDSKDQRFLAFLLLNLGQIATETGDQALATQYLTRSMAICQEGHIERGIADIFYLQAAVERRSGRPGSALSFLDQSLTIAQKLKNPDLFASVYEEYAFDHEARGDFQSALKFQRMLASERDIMRGDKIRRHADEIQTRYASEARAREIKLLQRDKDLQQADLALKDAELRHARSQRYALVALFALSAAAVSAGVSRLSAQFAKARRLLAQTTAEKHEAVAADAIKSRLLDETALKLSNSEARFQSAFEHSALGLALVAPDGRWLSVNNALCNIVGYTADELMGKTFQDITLPEDLTDDLDYVRRMLAREIDAYHLEKRYRHKGGRVIWVALDVSMVTDSSTGKPSYFISQVCDITANKDAAESLRTAKEEAERANNAKSEFLSRMSHELRTPLNAILGFGQLLGSQDLGRRPNESVGHILTAGRHLLGLIDEVLDLARVESGKLELSFKPASVAAIVVDTLELVRPLALQAGVRLRPIATDDGAHAAADPRRLKQILLNLVSNAIKYNHAGGEVGVHWEMIDNRVRIEVSDTGPGISEEDRAKIGRPFARLAATEEAPGTGLGLSLTKALVAAMNGTFGFISQLGVGSTFWIELETAEAPDQVADMIDLSPSLVAGGVQAPEHSLVLYIEDNLTNLQLVEHLYETHENIRLITAMQGQQGLRIARERRPEVILLDLHLPDLTGEHILRELAAHPDTASIPVIVISADATPASIERMKELGVRDYLTKPFDIARLRRAIEGALASSLAPVA